MSDETVNVAIAATTDQLESGMQRARGVVDEGTRGMQESFDKMGESIKGIGELIGVAFTAEALKEFASKAFEAAEQVDHLSQSLGLSVQNIQAMSFAAGVTGGSLETVTSAFTRLERSAQMAAAGSVQQLNDFKELGISSTQLAELLKHPDELINTVTKDLAGFADGTGKTAVAIELMGRNAASIIPFINQFGGNIQEATNRAREFGILLSDEAQNALVKTQEGLNLAKLAAQGMGNEFAVALSPAVQQLSKDFVDLATSDAVKNFFKELGSDISQFLVVAHQVESTISGWVTFWTDLGGAVSKVGVSFMDIVNPLGSMVTALGQVTEWFGRVTGASLATTNGIKNDVAGWAEWIKDKTIIIASDVEKVFLLIQKYSIEAWTAAENAVINYVKNSVIELGHLADYTNIFQKLGYSFEDGAKQLVGGLQTVTANTADLDTRIKAINISVNSSVVANEEAATADRQHAAALQGVGAAADDAGHKILDHNAKVAASADGIKALVALENELATKLDAMSTDLEGPYAQAWASYSMAFDKAEELVNQATQEYEAGRISIEEYDADVQIARDLQAELALKFNQTNQKLKDQHDLFAQGQEKLNELHLLMGVAVQDQQAVKAALDEYDKLLKSHYDFYGTYIADETELKAALDSELPGYVNLQKQIEANDIALKNSQQAMKEWQTVATNAFDSAFAAINKDIIEGGSVMKDLVNVAKQVVEAILMQFEKLAIINPLLNQIFGLSGTSGQLPTTSFGSILNNISGGGQGGGFGNLLQSWFGGGGGAASTDLAGGGVLLQTGDAAGAGGGSILSSLGGTDYSGLGSSTSAATAGGGFSPLGALGGVMAGYGEFQAAGGGIGGLAGGAAYGIGTYFAASAVTAGLGAAAAGGLSAGLAAGFAAIPVVGWIAIAAMALNAVTGGGLFGTAGKPIGGNFTESYGPSGGSVTDEMTISGKKPLFGGRYFDQTNIPDPQGQAAADSFFQALSKGQQAFADSLGDKMTQTIAGGSWTEKTDKTGKPVAGSEVTTIGGQTFKGETETQFQERLQSQAFLEVLDQLGLGASKFVAGVQGDADKLFAAVQDFAGATQAANANLIAGFKFMALGADETLPEIMKFVEGEAKAGETLSAAYNRLMQAQAAYEQFVGQFKPAATFVDPFEASMAQLFAQMKAAMDQANALAIAAGGAGANVEDLTNITKSYAGQMAQLTLQLENSAQQLAFSLGLTTTGSLDQVTQEINRLEGQSSSASSSISNFGSAMTSAANQANAATNLLIGSLSPLNDQAKLQVALQGLHAGTVSADQVLQIGRQLYASSQAYTDLFNSVMPYANQGKSGGASYSGGGSSSSSSHTLSPEDQARLDALLKEQAAMQAAQTLGQYQTLASQIEEIANAKGEDFQSILKEMGINAADLEKGLGLKSDADLQAYMDALKKQTDSSGNNTASIVSAVVQSGQGIIDAILGRRSNTAGGPLVGRTGTPLTPDTSTPAPSTSSTTGGAVATVQLSPDNMRAFAREVAQQMFNQSSRSLRVH